MVGATYPEQGRRLRELMPHTWFLVPGYGAQGAGPADIQSCFNPDGYGAIINASRSILYAYRQEAYGTFGANRYAEAAAAAVRTMQQELAAVLRPWR